MGLLSKLFGIEKKNSECINANFNRFQQDTSSLLTTGIKMLQANSDEGGFVKIFFDSSESELIISLSNSSFNKSKSHCENDWKKFLCLFVLGNNAEAEAAAFIDAVKIDVDDEDAYETDINFYHYYSYPLSVASCKKWFIDFMTVNYPNLKLKINSKDISFVI